MFIYPVQLATSRIGNLTRLNLTYKAKKKYFGTSTEEQYFSTSTEEQNVAKSAAVWGSWVGFTPTVQILSKLSTFLCTTL